MSDRELLAAADLACQQQVWDRCINTSERTRSFADWSQRFPMPFHDTVLARSRSIGLDPAYVYGLIRQESRLDRKSTRLNSSHLVISYAVFCLKKKKKPHTRHATRSPHCLLV